MEILSWVGCSGALFAALLMFTKSESSISDKILTGWLSLLAIEFLTSGIDYNIYGTPLLSSSFLLFNPAFFIYIRSLTNSNFRLKWIYLLHLAPFICFEVTAYILKEPYILSDFFDPDSTLWFRYAFSVASLLSWIMYNTLSIKMVHHHRMQLKNEFSTIDRYKKLGWLLFVIISYNIYSMVLVMIGILVILFNGHVQIPYLFNYSALLAMVYILGFYGIRQRMIYQTIYPETLPIPNGKTSATSVRNVQIKEQLLHYFSSEKPYLNPDLNMQLLSERLKIPKYQLTELLNKDLGKNFFQFVNEYRISAVKQMLSDKKNPYSIEAIGYECGFNSKSTFFTVFKNLTGMTPLQYREKV
jgi:AraC-like DNA-binding protein